ncbi:MAG TPA: D-alanyl-D-alanine carboxypeptidase family protein [Chloroflexota bacterium]|nr:D-alanyl-D-alanine carboxypeptidase family protein [Chloroflexota bacterium]
MRRSEAVLLFLLIATAVAMLATRPHSPGSGLLAAGAQAAGVRHGASLPGPTATPVPVPTATPRPPLFSTRWLDAHPPLDVPPITAQGAIVVDLGSRQELYAKDATTPRPPASIMKLMTAMVALDDLSPSRMVTVSPSATAVEPDHMGLTAGEQLPVTDLLYGLLLDSGNDAAMALAEAVPGGANAFVAQMNAKAAALGLPGTHFVDPDGLDDANRVSPYAMAAIGATALDQYPLVRKVVGTKQIVIPSTPTHKWFNPINLNDLLWAYPGTYGMKVGYTDAAQYTIVLAGQKNGHNVLIVLMGSQHHFTEGRALFTWAYAHLPADAAA